MGKPVVTDIVERLRASDITQAKWFRECYRFPGWRHRIGWPDGFARSHWTEDRDACQAAIDAVIARGGEAFMEAHS